MLKIACLCLAIAAASPLWSQVEPSATGGGFPVDDEHMMTPPPVSNGVYPVNVGVESRSNFITGGLVITGAYNDNILTDLPEKVSDSNYSIVPMIALDRRTPHQSMSLDYSSGFTLYQKSTELNGVSQAGSGAYDLHITPYATVSVSDNFGQNTNLFNQSNPFSGGGVSAGGSSPSSVYIFPFQNQLVNTINAGVQYQYARNAMIGGGGTYSIQRFADISNTPGLDNTNMHGGSAFWSRRITGGQYLGIVYEYSRINTDPIQTNTDTNTIKVFYTKYLTRTISVSVLGGPQRYGAHDPASGVSTGGWTPAIEGSAGYQKARTSFSVAYGRTVTGAGGLVGSYQSNIANANARRQITRRMTIGVLGDYATFKNVIPVVSETSPGGHTIAGTAFLQRTFREHLNFEVGYSRFHQSYGNFGTNTKAFPDSNREYASVSYQFYRPLGR